jgi:hypothetical protein
MDDPFFAEKVPDHREGRKTKFGRGHGHCELHRSYQCQNQSAASFCRTATPVEIVIAGTASRVWSRRGSVVLFEVNRRLSGQISLSAAKASWRRDLELSKALFREEFRSSRSSMCALRDTFYSDSTTFHCYVFAFGNVPK